MNKFSQWAALALTAALGALGLTQAHAGEVAHDDLVSSDPVDWTPHVEDGRVRATATVGGITIAVGDFTTVTEAASGRTLARDNIFAFDSTGNVSETFVPDTHGGRVLDVVSAGDGHTVYIAGYFTRVDDTPRTSRIARLDVETGSVIRSFGSPGFNAKVEKLRLANGQLYAAGQFTKVAGEPRTLLSALDPETGVDTGSVDLKFEGTWNGGDMRIESVAMRPDGSQMVVIGNFTTVEGQSRPQIAMIDLSGDVAELHSWATNRYTTRCSRSYATYMTDVDTSPDGTYFVVVTTGAYSGGPSTGTLCDTAARWEFVSSGPNQQPTWVDYSGGDTFTAVEVTGSAIYVGGHFRWLNNPFRADAEGPGAVSRRGIAALDPANGLPLAWNPKRQRGWGVAGFDTVPGGLWVGHDTDRIGGEVHKRLAFLPFEGGPYLPPNDTGSLPGDVYLLGVPSPAEVLTAPFDGTTAGDFVPGPGSDVDWSLTRGAFMVDRWLYYGSSDGTMQRRYFNGRSFGVARTVDVRGLTAFEDELPGVRAMFFDRDTGRLYYTKAGEDVLYYRYFTHHSQTVGALRFEQPTPGIPWNHVQGGFLANGSLYFSDIDGRLSTVSWHDGAPSGAVTVLSGPGTDGLDWRAQGLFLRPEGPPQAIR